MHSTRETWFILISVPIYIIFIGAEIIMSHWGDKKLYTFREVLQNIFLTLMNAGLDLFLRWAFYVSVLMWSYSHHFFQIENIYLYWFTLFILEDLAFYAEHRVDHYSRIFWQFISPITLQKNSILPRASVPRCCSRYTALYILSLSLYWDLSRWTLFSCIPSRRRTASWSIHNL